MKDKKAKIEKESKDIVKTKEKKSSNEVIKKWLSKTSLTIILIAIIIGAYVAINLLTEKANLSDIDLTKDKIFTLSETSKTIIHNINQDVEIILVKMDTYSQSVVDFAYKYKKENDKIKITEVSNVTKYPELTAEYNLTENTYEIIVRSGKEEKIISTSDLYTYDYSTGKEKDLTEEAITNALLSVTTENKPKLYFVSGHNDNLEYYLTNFKKSLEDEANTVESLDLLTTAKVPDDCSALVITTLNNDLKTVERDAILKYIKAGGKIILFTDAKY